MSHNNLGFLATPTVLVIDDDPDLCELLALMMDPWATVLTATSGDEGLQMCRLSMPDLVLLDVQMPGLDGFDVINELKHDSTVRHIPVVFITAETFAEVESECLEAGAADYIAKPINERVLTARVRTQVLLKQQADRLGELAVTDGLTGTMNRRAFDERLVAEMSRARRNREPVSMLVVDIDDLTGYNRAYGHLAGDAALQQVASVTRSTARRRCDVLGRIADGRFGVLLPGTSAESATRLGAAIVDAMRESAIPFRGSDTGALTIRVGVVDSLEAGSVDDLVAAAFRSAGPMGTRSRRLSV